MTAAATVKLLPSSCTAASSWADRNLEIPSIDGQPPHDPPAAPYFPATESDGLLYRRAVAVSIASRLDSFMTNAEISRAANRRRRAIDWESSHVARRERPDGSKVCIPVAAWSRSWWTDAGRRRLSAILRERAKKAVEEAEATAERPKLLTLTFRSAVESWAARDALRAFLGSLRHWAARRGAHLTYLWVAEVQKRYALHYHIVLVGCPYLRRRQLRDWWPHGWHDIRAATTGEALAYATKYVRKAASSGSLDAEVRHLMHSAAQLRRYGCSRNLSARPEVIPHWAREIAYMNRVEVEQLDWLVIPALGAVVTFTPGYQPETWDWELLRWHVTHRMPSDPSS